MPQRVKAKYLCMFCVFAQRMSHMCQCISMCVVYLQQLWLASRESMYLHMRCQSGGPMSHVPLINVYPCVLSICSTHQSCRTKRWIHNVDSRVHSLYIYIYIYIYSCIIKIYIYYIQCRYIEYAPPSTLNINDIACSRTSIEHQRHCILGCDVKYRVAKTHRMP